MKRKNIWLAAGLLCLFSCRQTPKGEEKYAWSEKDLLKTCGTVIRNHGGQGDTIVLKGINLGGWLLREGWMDPIGFDYTGTEETLDDHTSRLIMADRFGDGETGRMLDVYQRVYIQESDLDVIKSMGLNFIRVPFYWQVISDTGGEIRSNAFDRLDWVIEQAKLRGMYVILDLHGAPGGHSDGYLTGGQSGSNLLWTNGQYREWTVKIWEALAARYKDEPAVMGYDLLNEPVASTDAEISVVEMYDMLYRAVRKKDPDHIIIMGAFYNFDYLCDPSEKGWENVVYQTHHYCADMREDYTVQEGFMEGQLEYLKKYRDLWGIPLYAGEYNFWNHYRLWERWMTSLSAENIMWSSWTYKNTDCSPINNWGVYICNDNPRPDLLRDTKEEIVEKWELFASEYYTFNRELYEVISRCARD